MAQHTRSSQDTAAPAGCEPDFSLRAVPDDGGTEFVAWARRMLAGYAAAMDMARVNFWEYDARARALFIPENQIPMVDLQSFGNTFLHFPDSAIEQRIVHPDDAEQLRLFYQRIHAGVAEVKCAVRFLNQFRVYTWTRLICRVEQDEAHAPVRAVGIACDIEQERQMERSYFQEYSLRNSMVSDALAAYEFNLTQNKVRRTSAPLSARPTGPDKNTYTALLDYTAGRLLYPPHREAFLRCFSPESLLSGFATGGKCEVTLEYRRLNNDGKMVWVSNTTHLVRNDDEIYAFTVVRDINERKQEEADLKRKAETDSLTGLSNRAAIVQQIESLLSRRKEGDGICALMVLDLDHFKTINDTYGHMYGDAVLSEISRKLQSIFRPEDHLGRLGGDEFLLFLDDLPYEQIAVRRAKEVCDGLCMTFSSGNQPCQVSASVGIAFAPAHGVTFDELYKKADAALYFAKANGKNRFEIFDGSGRMNPNIAHDIPQEPDDSHRIRKNFSDNLLEYVFNILHSSGDLDKSIAPVLELLARHYDAQRAYIYERFPTNGPLAVSFQWCAENTKPINGETSATVLSTFHDKLPFDETGLLCVQDVSTASPTVQAMTSHLGVESLIQCAIQWNGKFYGFVGVDVCTGRHQFTPEEISSIRSVTNIIAEHLIARRTAANLMRQTETLQSVLNLLDFPAYVMDPKTRRLVFINTTGRSIFPTAREGEPCYASLRSSEHQCDHCPALKIVDLAEGERHVVRETDRQEGHQTISAEWVRWPDGGKYCLISNRIEPDDSGK